MRRKNITSEMMMEYIAQALVLLMRKKNFSDITIGDITSKAGVNRSTYYRHFETKESVVRYYLHLIMREYLAKFRDKKSVDYREYMSTMFETFYLHKADLIAIHNTGMSICLLEVLEQYFDFEYISKHSSSAQQFKASYHIGGIYNNMLLWFSHGMSETPEEMTNIAMAYKPEKALTLFNTI